MRLANVIQVYALTSTTPTGPVYSTAATSIPAEVEMIQDRIISQQGVETTLTLQVITAPDAPINDGDRIAYRGRMYEVIDVSTWCNLQGSPHHLEIRAKSTGV